LAAGLRQDTLGSFPRPREEGIEERRGKEENRGERKGKRGGEVAHPQKLSKVSAYVICSLFKPYLRCSSFLI